MFPSGSRATLREPLLSAWNGSVTTNAFASRWLVPRLPRWRKVRPNAPLDVIGTDGVLDLHAGDADVAIRYARTLPADGIAKEFLSDSFWPVCNPELFSSGGRLKRAADLRKHVLVHCWWSPSDLGAPTWQRWLDAARRKWRDVPESKHMDHLSFREELHAIEAVIGGRASAFLATCSWRANSRPARW